MVLLGFGALGSGPLGGFPLEDIRVGSKVISLVMQGIIVPDGQKVSEGVLLKSTSAVWSEIARVLANDWSQAWHLTPEQWEEMVAGAYEKAGYRTILTPRSGDFGRDVIASREGVGAIKVLGSVKRYAPDHLVDAEACRSLLGVLGMDRSASKGIISTTSDFSPKIEADPFIAPALPYRLELMNGEKLQSWLKALAEEER